MVEWSTEFEGEILRMCLVELTEQPL